MFNEELERTLLEHERKLIEARQQHLIEYENELLTQLHQLGQITMQLSNIVEIAAHLCSISKQLSETQETLKHALELSDTLNILDIDTIHECLSNMQGMITYRQLVTYGQI